MTKNGLSVSKKELSVADRDAIFDDMHPITQQVAASVYERIAVGNAAILLTKYDMGVHINKIMHCDDMTEAEKGQELKKLATFWNQENISAAVLGDLGRVADAFDRDFIKAEANKALDNGRLLSFAHFKELQKVGTEKKRLALLDKVRKNSWSASQLSAEMQANDDVKNTKFGGRKPVVPTSPNTAIRKLFNNVLKTGKYIDIISEPLGGDFLQLNSEEIDPKLIGTVENTKECLEDAIEKFEDAKKLLQAFLEHCLNNLNSDDELEDEEDDEEYESEVEAEAAAQHDSFDDEDDDYSPTEHEGKVVVSAKVAPIDPPKSGKKRGRPRRADVIVEESSIDFAPEVDDDDDE